MAKTPTKSSAKAAAKTSVKTPRGPMLLEKSVRRPRHGAHKVGPSDPKETLTVTVRVRRKPDAPALPDPSAPGPRRIISHADFAATYGAAQADVDKVTGFAKKNGLKVVDANLARRTVILSGTVAQMNKAFGVELARYKTPTESYRGREGAVQLPASLANIVEGVFGLDNRRMARRAAVRPMAKPQQSAQPLTPPQVAGLYNFPNPPATNQTIGLLEFGGGYTASDIQAFFQGLNLATPTLTAVSVDGVGNSPGDADTDTEVALDIDVSGSVGHGSNIAVYFAPWTEQGWVDIVNNAIHPAAGQPTPSVLSISWGWPELEEADSLSWTQQAIDAVSATFQEAGALGITIFVASGDHGSNCGISDKKAHVSYPGSDPWITSCGGTILTNVSGSSFDQGTWQDNNNWATGGGISDVFTTVPTWQANAKLPGSVNDGHAGRGIPDVAGNADSASGYNLTVDGQASGPVGGTSAVAPLYAGLVALVNSNLPAPVGFLNTTLYSNPSVCQDINDGVSNATYGAPGYKSGPGWDGCTGLGSINGTQLLAVLKGAGGQ